MPYAFTYDVPINAETYARIMEGVGRQTPVGLIAHLAHRTDTGLRYIDVWESEEHYKTFENDRLHPVVHPMLQDMLGFVPPEPQRTMLDLVDAWTSEHATT